MPQKYVWALAHRRKVEQTVTMEAHTRTKLLRDCEMHFAALRGWMKAPGHLVVQTNGIHIAEVGDRVRRARKMHDLFDGKAQNSAAATMYYGESGTIIEDFSTEMLVRWDSGRGSIHNCGKRGLYELKYSGYSRGPMMC